MSEELTESQKIIIKKSLGDKAKNIRSKEDNNIIYTSYYEDDTYILEQISLSPRSPYSPRQIGIDKPGFVKYSKLDDTWEIVDEFYTDDKVYRPIDDKVYWNGGVQLPSGVEEYKSISEMVKEIKEFIHEGAEIPSLYENLFPYLAMFYWAYERFPFIPYIQFVGGTGTGKTTAMEVFGSICYKPIDTTGSLTISSIFRLATRWKGTLLIDEFDSVGEHSREMVSFLKSGVSDRLVYRTEGDVKNFDLGVYIVKAPKLFTSEKPIDDAGLQSRTIVVEMEKNKRKIPLYKLPKYYDKAMSIRNKLLLWRLRNLSKIDLTDVEYGFPELETFDRRVQQVITPIYYFSDEEARQEIKIMAKEQEEDTLRERRESDEGKIFEAIVDTYNVNMAISLGEIAIILNKNKRIPVQERMIGQIIRKILGFEIKRVGTGADKKSIVIIESIRDISRINDLASYYGTPIQILRGESGESGEG